jgi:hypothetical protein
VAIARSSGAVAAGNETQATGSPVRDVHEKPCDSLGTETASTGSPTGAGVGRQILSRACLVCLKGAHLYEIAADILGLVHGTVAQNAAGLVRFEHDQGRSQCQCSPRHEALTLGRDNGLLKRLANFFGHAIASLPGLQLRQKYQKLVSTHARCRVGGAQATLDALGHRL